MNLEPILTPSDVEKVRALLQCWAEWRGTVRQALLGHMRPRCTLGRLVSAARQEGELWAHNEAREVELDDRLMVQVSQILATIPARHVEVLKMEYIDGKYDKQKRKAKRLRIDPRHYRRVLTEAHEMVLERVDWRNVLVA